MPVSRIERILVALVLAALALCVLQPAVSYFTGDEPIGADSSSHVLASATLAQNVEEGAAGWWMPHLNLGYPLVHFYQPLPHTTTALLALLLGGPEQATLAYKLLVVALLLILPIAAYVGFRRLELGRIGAVCGAVALTTLSAPDDFYGLTVRHYLFFGLYTMLWGAVVAPLALAEGVRFVQGRGRFFLAVGAFTLLFLTHSLLALGLIPVFAFAAFLPSAHQPRLGSRFLRLVLLGLLTLACIAFWLLPQLMCSDYFGGWPFGEAERIDGYGLTRVLTSWLGGTLLDRESLPVVTVLSIVGLAAAIRRFGDALHRVVVLAVALFVVFTAGRVTFGPLVDWVFPPNARMEGMSRYVALLDVFFPLAAGIGAGAAVEWLRKLRPLADRPLLAAGLVPVVLLAATLPRHSGALGRDLSTFPNQLDRPAYVGVAEELAEEPDPGRVYTNVPLGHQSPFAMSYLAMLTGKPMGISYAVGLQDSISFYYLAFLGMRDPERGAAEARLFNFRYLLMTPDKDVSHLGPELVARRSFYKVVRLPGEYGYFEVIAPPTVVEPGPPVQQREAFYRWMKEGYPIGAPFLRSPDPIRLRFPSLPSATSTYRADQAPTLGSGDRRTPAAGLGSVLSEEVELSAYRAEVDVAGDEAWLLLKVTAHPFWSAHVDGEVRPVYLLSPTFMGLQLTKGTHSIDFSFRSPLWQRILLIASPVFLLALAYLDARGRRSRPAPAAHEPIVPQ